MLAQGRPQSRCGAAGRRHRHILVGRLGGLHRQVTLPCCYPTPPIPPHPWPSRFPGHPESIDALIAVNANMACTGSSDGLVRLINVHPNTLVGVLGEHGDFPVERLCMCRPPLPLCQHRAPLAVTLACRTHDHAFIASVGHDQTVKFWESSELRVRRSRLLPSCN